MYDAIESVNIHAFYIRNHFIKNIHVDGRNILRTHVSKGKVPKELLNMKNGINLAAFMCNQNRTSIDTYKKLFSASFRQNSEVQCFLVSVSFL